MEKSKNEIMVDIESLDKIHFLQVLLNNAKKKCWIFPTYKTYSYDMAKEIFEDSDTKYFHIIKGRAIKVNLNGNLVNLSKYINHNGFTILYIINKIKENGNRSKNQ